MYTTKDNGSSAALPGVTELGFNGFVARYFPDASPAGVNAYGGVQHRASCPVPEHDDRNASLSVGEGPKGQVMVNCHKGCERQHVVAALGLTMAHLCVRSAQPPLPPRQYGPRKAVRDTAYYNYANEDGTPSYRVKRVDKADGQKECFYERYDARRGYVRGLNGLTTTLYRLPSVLEAVKRGQPVFVVEGEKCADALVGLGLTATTNSGGQGKWRDDLSEYLRGARVVILPDTDKVGEDHAQDVAASLRGIAASIKIVRLPGLLQKEKHGEDVYDWLQRGGTKDDLLRLADATPVLSEGQRNDEPSHGFEEDDGDDVPDFVPPPKWKPFPVEALPRTAATYAADAARAIGCDPAFVAVPMLSVLAAAVGNSHRISLKNAWREHAALWSMVIAPSGSAKSPALEAAIRPTVGLEAKAAKDYNEALQNASDTSHAAPRVSRQRYRISDATVEAALAVHEQNQRGLLLVRDELSAFFGSFDRYARGDADMGSWIGLYEGEAVTVDRKSADAPVLHIGEPCVSITGTIQPGILQGKLADAHFASGLAQRFLMVMPPVNRRRWTDDDVAPDVYSDYADLVKRLYALPFAGKPRMLVLSPGAKAAFVQYVNDSGSEMHSLPDGPLRQAFVKLEATAARLALVFHVADYAMRSDVPNEISKSAMKRGIEVARWFRYETARLYRKLGFEERGVSREVSAASKLMAQLPNPFHRNDVAGAEGVELRQASNIIKKLVEQGLAEPVKGKRGYYRPIERDEERGEHEEECLCSLCNKCNVQSSVSTAQREGDGEVLTGDTASHVPQASLHQQIGGDSALPLHDCIVAQVAQAALPEQEQHEGEVII